MENFQEDNPSQVYVQDPSFNYNAERRCFTITLPADAISGITPIVILDNNSNRFIGSDDHDHVLLFTTASVDQESFYTLTNRADGILPDLYDSSLNKREEPVHVQVVEAETGRVYKEFDIQLYKNDNTSNGFSSWTFGSTESTTMPIKAGAFEKNAYGERGDLNLLASTFILQVADLKVQINSRDNHIVDSFTGFRGCPTTQNRKKKKGK